MTQKKISYGDIIVHTRGKKPLEVISIENGWVYARYIDSGVTIYNHCSCYKLYNETND